MGSNPINLWLLLGSRKLIGIILVAAFLLVRLSRSQPVPVAA